LSIPRIATVRVCVVAAGIVAVSLAGKVTFAGLGAGTFNIAAWQVVLLALVGAALILIGWPWQKGKSADPDDELHDGTHADDEV
jgi:membrane protein implicated in regulation of membrane protease activity